MKRRRLIILMPVLLFAVTLMLGGVFIKDVLATGTNIYTELNLFNRVLRLVQYYYVEETEPDSLIQGAIVGMLNQLDPHSNYIDPDRFERMEERNRGSYSGIGISFDIRHGWLTVISPLEGGPSAELGIRSGDVITHIEGKSAYDIKENEVFEKLRGPKGTEVTVSIRRGSEDEAIEYTIVRDDIRIQSVPYAFMIEPGIGYIRMARFSAQTSSELEDALQTLEGQGMEGLILDLRGNSGGYLTQAVEVADKFLSGGKKIVYTQGRIFGSSEEYFATDDTHEEIPMVVLINQGSASASEIVSGAMQDWDRGLVAGTDSFGKGLVQRQYQLPNGGAVLLTVARYYTAVGRLIQRPYEGGDRDEYYRHAGESIIERLEASAESLAAGDSPADTSGGPPTFQTLLQGRTVYGGGGITPDVEIDEVYVASRLYTDLNFDRMFFDFVNELSAENRVNWEGSFQDFLAGFEVKEGMIEDFRAFLEADSFAFEPDSFSVHIDEMERGLRAGIANHLWGDDARYQVVLADDPQIHRAIALMPDAAALLSESHRIEAQRAAEQ